VNWRAIRAIVRKDLKVVFQNKGVMIPIIVVPLIFLVVLPGLAALVPLLEEAPGEALSEMRGFLEGMPAGLRESIAGYNETQTVVVLGLVYFLAPLYLILPLMVASVIAADSFAGEKERKTLEALLYTPATDGELFVGKALGAWLPAVVVSLVSFVLYTIVVNAAGYPMMGRLFFPNVMWLILLLWVVPAAAAFAIGVMVLVSSKARGFQDANQLGSTVVIPILLLVFGQVAGVLYFSPLTALLIGVALWAIDVVLIAFGVRIFKRGELIARL